MSAELSQVIEEIDALFSDDEIEQAQEKLDKAIETFGKTPELLAFKCEIDLSNEAYQEVIDQTNDLIGPFDYTPEPEALEADSTESADSSEGSEPSDSADSNESGDDTEEATEPKEHVEIDDATLARLHNARGYAYYYLDELDKARGEQNAAVRLAPEDYTAVIGRAMVHEDLNYLNAAFLDLKRAASLDDTEGQPHAIMASILMRWGQMEECQKELEAAIERDEEDLDSRLDLARFYALEQRTNDAMELLTYILSSDTDQEEDPALFAPALLLRSQLSLTLGSTEPALEDAERAKKLIPDLPWAYLQIAATKIHAQLDPEGAIVALKEAEKIAGNILDLPDLYALYAGAYQMLGKDHKVRKYTEEAEGSARLPSYVYGPLNPVENIPINPNRPLDFRRLLDDLFGSADKAPQGYEDGLRQAIQEVMQQLPQIREQNPGIERLEIQLPPAPGMIGGNRSILMELSRPMQTPMSAPAPSESVEEE